MDLSLSRLVVQDDMGRTSLDVEGWRWLVGQLASAVTPTVTGPAATVGSRGFELRLDTTITGLSDPSDCDPATSERCYWRRGTEGDGASTAAIGNRFPRSNHVLTRVAVRKGLPYGVELGFNAGRLARTSTWIWGGELKIALLEGFREGLPALIPDLAVRGAVSTMTGDSQLSLTVATLDLLLSKDLVAGNTLVLTPYVGGQLAWVFADSEVLTTRPGAPDAWATCGAVPGPPPVGADSTIRCTESASGYGDQAQFPRIRAFRPRMLLGFQLRYRPLVVSATLHWDLRNPDENADAARGAPRQWNVAVSAGLRY